MIAAPILNAVSRVRMGPGKPGKSWNFAVLESPGKRLLVLDSSVICLTQVENMKCMADSEKN